jgi:hypothetical protein
LSVLQNATANSSQHREAEADHQAESPEHRRHARHGIVHGALDDGRGGLVDVGHVFLQQQAKAEVGLVVVEGRQGLGVVAARAQRFQRIDGLMPRTMRARFFSLMSWMPGICLLTERVPIRPITQGISISQSFAPPPR